MIAWIVKSATNCLRFTKLLDKYRKLSQQIRCYLVHCIFLCFMLCASLYFEFSSAPSHIFLCCEWLQVFEFSETPGGFSIFSYCSGRLLVIQAHTSDWVAGCLLWTCGFSPPISHVGLAKLWILPNGCLASGSTAVCIGGWVELWWRQQQITTCIQHLYIKKFKYLNNSQSTRDTNLLPREESYQWY